MKRSVRPPGHRTSDSKETRGVPPRIDRPIPNHPGFYAFDGGLLDFPGIVTGVHMRPRAFVQFWGIAASPSGRSSCDRAACPRWAIISREVAVAERIPQVPAHARKDTRSSQSLRLIKDEERDDCYLLAMVSARMSAETIASASCSLTRGLVGRLTRCLAASSARGQEPIA